mmetsp:Transcript_40592/g.95343  ORF Transcript_40592/g.95343 Transcript_40592/m.95343 type:complete len:142 (+) Transcript_40592:91-516(+)
MMTTMCSETQAAGMKIALAQNKKAHQDRTTPSPSGNGEAQNKIAHEDRKNPAEDGIGECAGAGSVNQSRRLSGSVLPNDKFGDAAPPFNIGVGEVFLAGAMNGELFLGDPNERTLERQPTVQNTAPKLALMGRVVQPGPGL